LDAYAWLIPIAGQGSEETGYIFMHWSLRFQDECSAEGPIAGFIMVSTSRRCYRFPILEFPFLS
jgi:hypothetical protein